MEVGSVYKLDHSKLPKSVLSPLGHVQAVMVSERTRNRVSVSYPSKGSLEMIFGKEENGGGRRPSSGMMQPSLDLVYTMNVNLAETVLCNRISFEEFATRRGSRSFWINGVEEEEEEERDGGGVGLRIRWGLRKRVSFVRKHRENAEKPLLLEGVETKEEDGDEDSMEVEGGERKLVLRKRKHPSKYVKKKKKKKRGPVEVAMNGKGDEFNDPTSEANFRWTKERYKKAEKGILKIMKAKGAFHGFPILRADLRTEARKLIGDTGLLDHLLKHMAGKTAPGGNERFRRRHNPDGAMEYWLESADLVTIRKEAGVDDPYWIPPEGWKLGDSPTQDPACAKELKQLREDVDQIKSEIQERGNKKSGQAIVDVHECLDDDESRRKFRLMSLKAKQEDLLRKKAKVEDQLSFLGEQLSFFEEQVLNVAKALSDMEEDLGVFVLEAKGKKRVVGGATTGTINEGAGEICSGGKEREKEETKAARRQRLKSGFRICKPTGTFIWPADITTAAGASFTAQVMYQVDDFLALSSPSSVCSSKSPLPPPQPQSDHLLLLPPPPPPQAAVLRPVAQRPSLGVSVSTVTRGWSGSYEVVKDKVGMAVTSPTASSANSVFVPDLNEAPLDGHPPTNVDSPCFTRPAYSSTIQGIFPYHPSGGTIALRTGATTSMHHAMASSSRLGPVPQMEQFLSLPSPLPYTPQVLRAGDV